MPPPPAGMQQPPVPVPNEQPAPVERPAIMVPVAESGMPVRVIEDRKEVTFNPDKPVAPQKPVVKKQQTKKAAAAPVKKTVSTNAGGGNIYVQFGSYSTRAAAQSAEQKIRGSHSSLFGGKQFVILAAQVNGKTTYRLRIAFNSANEANGFCRNAKSDGLDCYVTK